MGGPNEPLKMEGGTRKLNWFDILLLIELLVYMVEGYIILVESDLCISGQWKT